MTSYKKIVAHLLEMTAQSWVEQLMEKNGIEYTFTSARAEEIKMKIFKDLDTILWDIPIEIYRKGDIFPVVVTVGGSVDDESGICKSVIWGEGKKLIWMGARETREKLGIDRFDIE